MLPRTFESAPAPRPHTLIAAFAVTAFALLPPDPAVATFYRQTAVDAPRVQSGPTATVYRKTSVDSSLRQSGLGPSLVIDSQGAPHVAYVDIDPSLPGTNGAVRWATRSGASWALEDIEAGSVSSGGLGTSLALGSQDVPNVTYVMTNQPSGNVLRYARRIGGSWVGEDVVSGSGIRSFSSLALDAQGHAHVCYFLGVFDPTIRYARNTTGAWVTEPIGTNLGAIPAAIFVTSQGQPKIVFQEPFSGLKIASRQPSGLWTIQLIDNANSLVAIDIHCVMDAQDRIHISYRNYTLGTSKYAFQSGAGWTVLFTPVTSVSGGPAITAGGLDIAPDGTAYLSYTASTSNSTKLRLATRATGGAWSVETVDNSPGTLGIPSLGVGLQGERHFAYPFERVRFSSRTELRHAESVAGATGRVLRVPAEYPTIQAGIDAGDSPDTVRVSPGTYGGIVDFHGKSVVVEGNDGPAATILDGQQHDGVVIFNSGEEPDAVLQGFTIRNGAPGPGPSGGSGIYIAGGSSPTIRACVITGNRASQGAGIVVYTGSPTIERNEIVGNHASFDGGGIHLSGSGRDSALIVGNHFAGNDATQWGGAIYMFNGGTPLVRDNVFESNSSLGEGGAISMVNSSSPSFVQNMFARNRSARGGAIRWSVPNDRAVYVIQNTFADNIATQGSAVYTDGFDQRVLFDNNVIASLPGVTGVVYSDLPTANRPIFRYNDVFTAGGTPYGGDIPNQTGINHNISADPAFADRAGGDYRLSATSPCIDVGDGAAPLLPSLDLRGQPRVQDGDQNGSTIVDLGAFEFGRIPLTAHAGPDIVRPCAGGTTPVQLDGRASTGDGIVFAWSAPGIAFDDPSSPTPIGAFPVGRTEVTLLVTSGAESARDTVAVTIVDTSPPSVSVAISPALLWPPNHQLVDVHATVSAEDACSSDLRITLVSAHSNEPDDGPGNHSGDIQAAALGTPDFDVQLRAERTGNSAGGRVYTLCYEVRDGSGNADTACAAVVVPHDQAGRAQLAANSGRPSLVIFGGGGLVARGVSVASVEIHSGERLTFRAAGGEPLYRDTDGDGLEDAVVDLQWVAADPAGVPLATWTAQGRGYVAVLAPVTLAVDAAQARLSASVFPNPASGAAWLRYGVPREGRVRLEIYDIGGRRVATLVDGVRPAGMHEVAFRPARRGAAQVYFYRYEAGGRVLTGKFAVRN
jgi:hypothetical protein